MWHYGNFGSDAVAQIIWRTRVQARETRSMNKWAEEKRNDGGPTHGPFLKPPMPSSQMQRDKLVCGYLFGTTRNLTKIRRCTIG